MKIGILTFHRAHNYGAVLQAYALRTYLRQRGLEAHLIDYWPEYRKGQYDLLDRSFLSSNASLSAKLKRLLRQLAYLPFKYQRHRKFSWFIRNDLGVNGNSMIERGEDIPDQYDVVITGSDQVWRHISSARFDGFDAVYWGRYPVGARGKKITYAASMGVLNYAGHESFIRQQLAEFDAVSVRESELKEVVDQLSERPVKQVIDPVFLLNEDDWDELIELDEKGKGKYLIFYHLIRSEKVARFVERLAQKHGLKVIELKGGDSPFANPFRTRRAIGPIDYLKLFRGASYVVSTSFHGVAFSIIFQKQFYALGMQNNSGRVTSLLESLGLGERYLDDRQVESYDFNAKGPSIDYASVGSLLSETIDESKRYLADALSC